MIPLYGFLEGDSIGLLILAYEDETIEVLKNKLKNAASMRVRMKEGGTVVVQGEKLRDDKKLSECGLTALDRFDVRWS